MKSVKNLIWILVAFELLNSCATKKAKVDELDEIFKEGFEISWSDPKAGGRLFQKGSELAQKRNNQVMHALFLVNLGAIATTTGNYPKALDYYAQSLELQRTLPNHEEVEARILASIGKTYEDLGDFSKAEIHFKEAVAITQRIKQQWDESTFMGDLGRIYTKLGDPRKALEQHQLALEVAESLNDKERQGVAWDNIGLVFIEQKDYIKALEAFQKALSLSTDTGGFPDPYWINLHISDLYLAQQSPKALQNLPKNLDSIRLGYFHLQNNNYELAQTQFEKTIESGKTLRRANQLVSGYLGLALTLENRENISQARDTYDLAIAEIERQRDLLPLTARQTFLSGKAEGFLPRLEAYQGRARVSKDPAEGFYWTEYTKARVFVESLSEKFRNKASELPLDLALVERESSEKILSL